MMCLQDVMCEMECVKVGTGEKTCWIAHGQHPGENMAEYFAEGFLSRLLGGWEGERCFEGLYVLYRTEYVSRWSFPWSFTH